MAARSGARKRDTAIPSRTTACGETRPAGVDSPGTMKYWEIIADDLTKAGWSWGCVSAIDAHGRTIRIADAHCGDGKRFIVRAEEELTAFLTLERAVCIHVLTNGI